MTTPPRQQSGSVLVEVPPRFELGNGGFADVCNLNATTEHAPQVRDIASREEHTGKGGEGGACPERVPAPARRRSRRVPRRTEDGDLSIYFIQCGGADGPIKIGHARDVARRLSNLQMGCPFELRLLASVVILDGAAAFEDYLHDYYRDLRIRGEWYRATPELVAAIANVAARDAERRAAFIAARAGRP